MILPLRFKGRDSISVPVITAGACHIHATPDRRNSIDKTCRSVIWYFMECDLQNFGYTLDLVRCRNIIVAGGGNFYMAKRNIDHLLSRIEDQDATI